MILRTGKFRAGTAALLACFGFIYTTFGQGSLTPPGPPAPVMKSLAEVEPRTAITNLPITITDSGSYYLVGTLTGVSGSNGVTIAANDVKLDLNGFALQGVPGSLTGISVSSHCTNLVVCNGIIRDWGGPGVSGFSFIHGGRFTDLFVTTNASLGLAVGYNCVVKNCVANYNLSYGIEANIGSIVADCTVNYNGSDGIRGQYFLCHDCVSTFNGGTGIFAYNYSRVQHCHCVQNAYDGIAVGLACQALENTCVNNNTSGSTGSAGIRSFYSPGHIEGNFVQFSSGIGIFINTNSVLLSSGWTVIRNRTSGPSSTAYVYPASGNDIGPIGTAAISTSPWANLRN